jgi:SAM-dependent methyltransferase
MSPYIEYPYETDDGTAAHSYLIPSLLSVLGPPDSRRILDVGCGNGFVSRALLEKGYDVIGLDASTEGIERAKRYAPGRFFVHRVGTDALPAQLLSGTFDIVVSLEVIEHIYAPRGFVDFCRNMLKPNGMLILSTPYHSYPKNLLLALTGQMDKHFTALWDSGHVKFWSRRTLSTLLAERGFSVDGFRGAGRLPYLWKSMVVVARRTPNSPR